MEERTFPGQGRQISTRRGTWGLPRFIEALAETARKHGAVSGTLLSAS